MKKLKSLIALVIFIIGGSIYVSNEYLDIDLLEYFNPDTEEPVIDISTVRTTITIDGIFDISDVTCEDNSDTDCTVEVIGSIDTSVLGSIGVFVINATISCTGGVCGTVNAYARYGKEKNNIYG